MDYRSRNDLDAYRQDIRHHPDDEAEVKRRLDGPHTARVRYVEAGDLKPMPYRLDDDRPMPPALRIVGGAVLATVLLGCVLVVAVRNNWL